MKKTGFRWKKKVLTGLIAGLIYLSPLVMSGQLPPGVVSGRVTERVSNRPVTGARVKIEERRQGEMRQAGEAITGEDGGYRLELAPGTYEGRVEAEGFATQSIGIVTV
ncbi:MAG: carboxypeptidase regulatory-like domain-containing protein, partial [Acidobacteria bacterium]|nr:carboxypeptidase regulatory-like domain-containing protein [Acidobacteriota bacterium]